MSLRIWLPLTKDLRQQGLDNWIFNSYGTITQPNTGKLGNCLKTGATGTVYNNNISLTLNGNFSISYWLRIDASQASYNNFFSLDYDGNHYCGMCYNNVANSGTIGWHVRVNINGTATNIFDRYAFTGLTVGQWYHIGLTMENGTICKMYLNGALIYTGNTSTTYPMTTYTRLTLGSKNYNNSYSNCSINDFRVYDHTLSLMEIKELAKGLVLHYPLNRQGWGQENLYTGSRDFSGTWVNSGLWTTSSEVYNGFTVKERSATWGGLAQNVTATNGDIFTISFYAKVASGGNIQSVHRSNLGNVTTGLTILGGNFKTSTLWVNNSDDGTQWKRYWATVQIVSSDITYLQWRIENSVADKKMSICGMKLEKGSIATPWCPNSSDTLATITGLNSTTEYDCSGFCNNGTRTGTFTWTSDTPKYNVSQYFQDYTRYITTPLNDWTPTSITLSCWIKSTNKTPRGNWHIPLSLDGQKAEISIGTTGKARIGFTIGGTRYAYDWGNDILNGTWHLITNVFDGNSMKMYVDGVLINSSNVSGALQSMNNLYVGRFGGVDAYGNTQLYESDVRIYATALSATDVLALYQNSAYIDSSGNVYGAVHSEV